MPFSAVVGAFATVAAQQMLAPSGGGVGMSMAQQMVDPFAAYRPQYAAQLNQLMQNPQSANLPGYTASLDQATQQLQRQAASTGTLQSGAESIALQNQTATLYNQFYQQQLQNLASLSGAAYSPSAGGQAGIGAANQQSANAAGLAGMISPAISKGVQYLFGSGQTPTAQNTPVDTGAGTATSPMSGQTASLYAPTYNATTAPFGY